MSFIEELKRRNVIRMGLAYALLAWILLQVSDVVLNNVSAPHWVFTAIVLVLGLGFVLVLLFAWVFEITPEGLKKEKDIDRSQSITPQTGRKLDRVTMALMAIALAYFAWDKFGAAPDATAPVAVKTAPAAVDAAPAASSEERLPAAANRSIAVLPFVDMSAEHDQEYLSDGIAEELLNVLAKIPDLQVAARTSSFSFKGKDVQIADVARELNVAHVLEGSVRKAGDRVRITAQLIQADNGFHLWSETYDRTLDDVFAIQDEISAAVVEALKIQLLGEAPKSVEVKPEAYALYLQGRYFYGRRSQKDWENSAAAFQQALQIDPTYAAAWAGLARTTAAQAGQSYIDLHQGYAQARQAVQKALELNPALAQGYVAQASIQMSYDWDWAGAEASLKRALELAPGDVDVLTMMGELKRNLGNLDEAIVLDRRAVALDPLSLPSYHALGLALIYAGRLDEAQEVYRHALDLNPSYYAANLALARILILQDQPEAALVVSEKVVEPFWRDYGVLIASYALGRTADADQLMTGFIERNQHDSAYQIAQIYGFRGDDDKVFEWLDRAYTQRDGGLSEILTDPFLTTFSGDPRWAEIVKKAGLYEAWLKHK